MIKLNPIASNPNLPPKGEIPSLCGDAIAEITEGSDQVNAFLNQLEKLVFGTEELKKLNRINESGWQTSSLKAVFTFTSVSTEDLVLPDSLKGIDEMGLRTNVKNQLKNLYGKNKQKFVLLVSTESNDVFSWFFNQFKVSTFYSNMLKEHKRKVLGRLDDISMAKFKAYHVSMESYETMMDKLNALEAIQNDLSHLRAADASAFSAAAMNNHITHFRTPLETLGYNVDPISLRVKTGEAGHPIESALLGELNWSPAKVKDSIDRVTHLLDNHKKVGETIKSIESTLASLKKNKDQRSSVTVTEMEKALLFTVSLSKHVTHSLYRITNCYSKLCEKIQSSR